MFLLEHMFGLSSLIFSAEINFFLFKKQLSLMALGMIAFSVIKLLPP